MSLFPNIDFKAVQWQPTLQLHLVRSFSAGVVWAVVMLLNGSGAEALGAPFLFPLMYFIGMPIYLGLAKGAAAIMGPDGWGPAIVGFTTLIFAIGIVVGDPVVYFLDKKWPQLVPVETFKVVNFVVVLFVYPPSSSLLTEIGGNT